MQKVCLHDDDDDIISSVSGTVASHRSTTLASVDQDHPSGDDHRCGPCWVTTAPHSLSSPGGLRLTFPLRHLAVCGGIVAAAIEDKSPGHQFDGFPQGAWLHRGILPWCTPLDEALAAHLSSSWSTSWKPHLHVTEKHWNILPSQLFGACWVSQWLHHSYVAWSVTLHPLHPMW